MIKVLAHSDDIDVTTRHESRRAVHPFSLIKENENKVFLVKQTKKSCGIFFSVYSTV